MNDVTAITFAVVLLISVFISGRAQRTVLSTAVIFLVGGFLVGPGVLGLSYVYPQHALEATLVQLALVSVLFTDGMRLQLKELRDTWHLPGRALLLGMPLTFLIVALLARLLFGISWLQAFLIGAALSPTDPVFASLIIEQNIIPLRLRRLLNIESGLNDGLALPVVLILLRVIGMDSVEPLQIAGELIGGVVIGVVVPWVVIRLEKTTFYSAAAIYEPLNAFAIGILVLALCALLNTNAFLAAYSAGITIATLSDEVRQAFERFGELLTELLKAASLFVLGMLMQPSLFLESGANAYVFAALVLLLARPLAIFIVLSGQKLSRLERITAAWFGPKGFASIFYALLVLKSALPHRTELFDILALTIVLSIILHSSTDILFTRWFKQHDQAQSSASAARAVEASED